MQHYLSCGIGINTSNISKEDWNMLADIPNIDEAINLDTSSNDFLLQLFHPLKMLLLFQIAIVGVALS